MFLITREIMLRRIRLQNYRSFADTKELELGKLNLFIGPNNAGKSTVLSAIELLFLSATSFGGSSPLLLSRQPAFASFEGILRKHWSPREPRPTTLTIDADWSSQHSTRVSTRFRCAGKDDTGETYVERAEYTVDATDLSEPERLILSVRPKNQDGTTYRVVGADPASQKDPVYFQGVFPFLPRLLHAAFESKADRGRRSRDKVLIDAFEPSRRDLCIIHPFRPVPRSVYVLDDPSLNKQDRELLASLVSLWSSETEQSREARNRINQDLSSLGLAESIEIKRSGKLGPRVAEIRVSTRKSRQKVSIADVGFGVSQALPLLVDLARLRNGIMIAYQPEVHLHPFAQSRLADVFARSLREGNRLFVETHSLDLILRLQVLIANGEVAASDVKVFCVEKPGSVSEILPLTFSETGVPSPRWPKGFLDTGLTLARELANARARRDR